MKKTLKEEMFEAIEEDYRDRYSPFNGSMPVLDKEEAATSCASIAEKHIKIARLEGMIEVYRMLPNYKIKTKLLEQELEKLKKQ